MQTHTSRSRQFACLALMEAIQLRVLATVVEMVLEVDLDRDLDLDLGVGMARRRGMVLLRKLQ